MHYVVAHVAPLGLRVFVYPRFYKHIAPPGLKIRLAIYTLLKSGQGCPSYRVGRGKDAPPTGVVLVYRGREEGNRRDSKLDCKSIWFSSSLVSPGLCGKSVISVVSRRGKPLPQMVA